MNNHRFRDLILPIIALSTIHIPIAEAVSQYDPSTVQESQQQTSPLNPMQDIKLLLTNLGIYWGYNLSVPPEHAPKSTLLTETEGSTDDLKLIAQYTFFALFGADPVNTFFMEFLPGDSTSIYVALNAWANSTFMSYETPAHTPVSVNALIDQQTYQKDPVSQTVLNILGTPDYTFCMDYSGTNWNNNCSLLYQNKIMRNVAGPLPTSDKLFSYEYQQAFLSELNGNALIAPMVYSVNSPNTNSTSSTSSSTSSSDTGLTAKSQVENAANFIRYAMGAVQPIPQIKRTDYDKQWAAANPTSTTSETSAQRTARENAEATLTNYLNSVRVYAAQSSVAAGNLYYILSKRLPQSTLNGSSQAVNELEMATRRIYNPEKNGEQWIDQINKASPTTVEKEMALLLAEINYQLYLNRQQDERLLLTNSLLLIQSLTQNKPSPTIEADANSTTTE